MALPYVIGGLALLSIGGQLLSAQAQANAIRANAEFMAEIAELNAQRAEIDAQEALRTGAEYEARYVGQTTEVMDSQTATFANEGVEVKGDATGDVVAASGLNAALNKLDIQNTAFMNASVYQREAGDRRAQAAIGKYSAGQAANAALISGYVGAISSAANYGMSAYKLGAFDGMGKTKIGKLAPGPSANDINGLSPSDWHDHWNNNYMTA